MKSIQAGVRVAVASLILVGLRPADAGGDPEAVPGKLKTAKQTLAQGIAAAQKENGVAISAKLEFEDGKLWLSVYTAKAGLEKDAEHNVLMELKGDATAAKWEPKTEVFEDKKHLTRAAMHLTAMQTATLSLEAAMKKAEAQKKGTPYSVIPFVRDGKTAFEVIVATPAGKSLHLTIEDK